METNLNITKNDFNSICRLCLNGDDQLEPICIKSETNTRNDALPPLNDIIITCLGLNVYNKLPI